MRHRSDSGPLADTRTGARRHGANAVCTQIGNDSFTWFGTTVSKNHLNFLDLLRAGHTDYVINDPVLDYRTTCVTMGWPDWSSSNWPRIRSDSLPTALRRNVTLLISGSPICC